MRLGLRRWRPLVLVGIAVLAVAPGAVQAQKLGPEMNLSGGGIVPIPPPAPQGALFEVIFADPRWMVVQNERGQQFPIAADAVAQFLIRWQADVRDLTPAVLVEARGQELASMTVQTPHIDIFVGPEQALVQPGYTSDLPFLNKPVIAIDPTFGRMINAYDPVAQNRLYSWVYPIPPVSGIPTLMHVVGNPVGLGPLRLGVPGNNVVNLLPPFPADMTMTQVTLGTSAFARKGDLVYLKPVQGRDPIGEKSLLLAQAVLYKKMRRDQFVP
jgi:hypothetical protein